jgi:TP901 family phage tail tape measure protein
MPDLAELTVVVGDRGIEPTTAKLGGLQGAFGRVQASLITFNQTLDVMSRLMRGASTVTDSIVGPAIRFESAFAGVRKTVNASDAELARLSASIRRMAEEDLPASTTEIAAVAEAAGQLGVETANIEKFTKTMIQLGTATNLSSQAAADGFARFTNITQLPKDRIDQLGSAVVALGNSSAATEAEILAMGTRLAGAGRIVGLADAEIMAMAASLASVGVEAEAGGTAFSRVFIEIAKAVDRGGKKLDTFSQLAGMTTKQFKEEFETNAGGAIVAFVEGLGQAEKQGRSTFGVLDELSMSDARLRMSLLNAANAGDLMRQYLELGNRAFRENTALTKEAGQRYSTTESQLQLLRNQVVGIATDAGLEMLPTFERIIKQTRDWIRENETLLKQDLKTFMEAGASAASKLVPELQSVVESATTLVNLLDKVPAEILEIGVAGALFFGKKGAAAIVGGAAALQAGMRIAEESVKEQFRQEERENLTGPFIADFRSRNMGIGPSKYQIDEYSRRNDVEAKAREAAEKRWQDFRAWSRIRSTQGDEAAANYATGITPGDAANRARGYFQEELDKAAAEMPNNLAAWEAWDQQLVLIEDDLGRIIGAVGGVAGAGTDMERTLAPTLKRLSDAGKVPPIQGGVDDDERIANLEAQAAILDHNAEMRQRDLDLARESKATLRDQLSIAAEVDSLRLQALEKQREGLVVASQDVELNGKSTAEIQGKIDLTDLQIKYLQTAGDATRELTAEWARAASEMEAASDPLTEYKRQIEALHELASMQGLSQGAVDQHERILRQQILGVRRYEDSVTEVVDSIAIVRALASEGILSPEDAEEQIRALRQSALGLELYNDSLDKTMLTIDRLQKYGPAFGISAADLDETTRALKNQALGIRDYRDDLADFAVLKERLGKARAEGGIDETSYDINVNRARMEQDTMEGAVARAESNLRQGISSTLKSAFMGEDLDWKEIAFKLVQSFSDAIAEQSADMLTDAIFGPLLGTSKGNQGRLSSLLGGAAGAAVAPAGGIGSMGALSRTDIATASKYGVTIEGAPDFSDAENAAVTQAESVGNAFLDVAGMVGQGFMGILNGLDNLLLHILTVGQAGGGGGGLIGSLLGAVVPALAAGASGYFAPASETGAGSWGSWMSGAMGELHRGGLVRRFHDGGLIEDHFVGPGLRRYHDGLPGIQAFGRLQPNEVPAILEAGELVIPKRLTREFAEIFEQKTARRYHEGGLVAEQPRPLTPVDLQAFTSPTRPSDRSDREPTAKTGSRETVQNITMPLSLVVQSIDPTQATAQIMRNEQVILNMVHRNLKRGGALARATEIRR